MSDAADLRRRAMKRFSGPAAVLLVLTAAAPASALEGGWTRRLITAVADQQAEALGYDPDAMTTAFDPGNVLWERVRLSRQARPVEERLAGRDFWAVYYAPIEPAAAAPLWVFIDRETGTVIAHFRMEGPLPTH